MGAFGILLSLTYYVLGIDMFSFVFYLINFLLLIGIYVGFMIYSNKTLCKKHLDGNLNYWDGVLNACITGLVAAIIGLIYNFVFVKFFDPEYMTKAFEKVMEMLENNPNIPQEAVEKAYKDMESMTPLKYSLQGLKMNLIITVIFALITAAFTRKKNDAFSDEIIIEEKSE